MKISTILFHATVSSLTLTAAAHAVEPIKNLVLLGHSYGGITIPDAGTDPKVKALVYVAALLPDVGNSVIQLAEAIEAVARGQR